MTTRILPADESRALAEAGEILRGGGLVAFPTETVYGLGGNALSDSSARDIFAAKGRPCDNPLIVHISDRSQLAPLIAEEPSPEAERLMDAFWPGPLTIIFNKSSLVPDSVTGGLNTVAVRMPSHPAARALIEEAGVPVAAPSANSSGRPSPTRAEHVLEDMNGKIPMILDGGACDVGVESTVLALDEGVPVILRPGGVTREMIEQVLGCAKVDEGVLSPVDPEGAPRSPGMKYRHYAPRCRVRIFRGEEERVISEISRLYDETEDALILCGEAHAPRYGGRRLISLGEGAEGAAHALFDALRRADGMNARAVFAEGVSLTGVGLAVMNRMGRAAAFDITDL